MESYRQRVERLKRAAGLSLEEIHYRGRRATEAAGEAGVSLSSVQKLLAPGASRRPSVDVLRAVAYGLGVAPEEFPEYRLAQARELLDEREVGLEAAVDYLEAIEAAGLPIRPDSGAKFERELQEAVRPSEPQADDSDEAGPAQAQEAH